MQALSLDSVRILRVGKGEFCRPCLSDVSSAKSAGQRTWSGRLELEGHAPPCVNRSRRLDDGYAMKIYS